MLGTLPALLLFISFCHNNEREESATATIIHEIEKERGGQASPTSGYDAGLLLANITWWKVYLDYKWLNFSPLLLGYIHTYIHT